VLPHVTLTHNITGIYPVILSKLHALHALHNILPFSEAISAHLLRTPLFYPMRHGIRDTMARGRSVKVVLMCHSWVKILLN
jgi:hypothetical protein